MFRHSTTVLIPNQFLNGCDQVSTPDIPVYPTKIFPHGKTRKVHVLRPAIRKNVMEKKRHPTIVVTDEDGYKHYYHAVRVAHGVLGFDPENPEANVYIVTHDDILCYTDPHGDNDVIWHYAPPQR